MPSPFSALTAGFVFTLAAAGPAHAFASASAEIGGITVLLIDLDPLDGITPALSFSNDSSFAYASTLEGGAHGDSALGAQASTWAASFGAFGSSNGRTHAGGASSASAVSGSPAAGGSYGVQGQGSSFADFELTPWTGVWLSTSFAGWASTSIGGDGVQHEWARAYGQLALSGASEHGLQHSYAYKAVYAGFTPQHSGQSDSFAGELRLSYANLSSSVLVGRVQFEVASFADSTLPVPEPGSAALLLAGLVGFVGFAGAATRLRRARAPVSAAALSGV